MASDGTLIMLRVFGCFEKTNKPVFYQFETLLQQRQRERIEEGVVPQELQQGLCYLVEE